MRIFSRQITVAIAMLGGCGDNRGGAADAVRADGRPPPDSSQPDAMLPDAGPPMTVTYSIVGLDGLPEDGDVVLVSDNGGAWHPMTGTGGVYTADVVGPRYAIARACREPESLFAEALLWHLTLEDGTSIADQGCRTSAATGTLTGALVGVAANQRGLIATNFGATVVSPGATTYDLTTPIGTTDLVGRLFPAVPSSQPRPTVRLLVERDVAITGDLDHPLDFAADGVDPETHTFVVSGAVSSETERQTVALFGPGVVAVALESTLATNGDYHTLPAGLMRPGELVTIHRAALGVGTFRSVALTVEVPVDLAAELPPLYASTAPTVEPGAPIRLAGILPYRAEADLYETSAIAFDDATLEVTGWKEVFTARFADGQPIGYAFPDLSGIGGWDITIPAGEISWNHQVTTSTAGVLPAGRPLPTVAGDTLTVATTSGTLTAP